MDDDLVDQIDGPRRLTLAELLVQRDRLQAANDDLSCRLIEATRLADLERATGRRGNAV